MRGGELCRTTEFHQGNEGLSPEPTQGMCHSASLNPGLAGHSASHTFRQPRGGVVAAQGVWYWPTPAIASWPGVTSSMGTTPAALPSELGFLHFTCSWSASTFGYKWSVKDFLRSGRDPGPASLWWRVRKGGNLLLQASATARWTGRNLHLVLL